MARIANNPIKYRYRVVQFLVESMLNMIYFTAIIGFTSEFFTHCKNNWTTGRIGIIFIHHFIGKSKYVVSLTLGG